MRLFTDYAAWLQKEYAAFQSDPTCVEIGPLLRPTVAPNSPPWNMDWAIKFPDHHYAYVYERWYASGPALPGRSRFGYREHFSFHYGPTNSILKANGIPERDKVVCPAIIRVDCDKHGPHLHFHGEADHIDQAKIEGMVIQDADPFTFMRAVLEHRAKGTDFDSILNFKVKP
jgi:hypothetical protein